MAAATRRPFALIANQALNYFVVRLFLTASQLFLTIKKGRQQTQALKYKAYACRRPRSNLVRANRP